MKSKFRALANRLMDSERDFQERNFLLLTIIAECAIFMILIADILIHENYLETAVMLIILFLTPIVTYYAINKGHIQLCGGIMAGAIIFVILPVSFFFGGGITGGSNIWFVFSYLYIGLILSGRLRVVMMTLLTAMLFASYAIQFFLPRLINSHSRSIWFMDSLISVVLVGFVVYIMVWFQNKLFMGESRRAKEQAREIEELNRAQNRFFSSMSHEIRTPINTIIGLNEMILREDVSDEVAEDARNIQSASKILLSLINDILDMSKMESGKMDIVYGTYNVGDMLSEIVNMIWVRAHEKGLNFTIDVDPNIPAQLYSDEVRIKQILINLLNNAVKYTQQGRVTLSVHLSGIDDDGYAVVTYSVEDTGMGIRKENIPHLFDAFKRVDEEKNKYIEGTGLGLSIVKQLTDLLGGTISVNSIYTKGSTFSVTIRQEVMSERLIGKFDPGHIHGKHDRSYYQQSFEAPEAKVLVVDDDSANLLVASKLLRDTKVQIDTASSGLECLEHTLQTEYNVILMDHMMPGMDGIECLRAIREQSGGLCKDTPVVILTANAGSENQALYRREGFDGYLLKPVDAGLLERTLLSLLPNDFIRLTGEGGDGDMGRIVRETTHKIPIQITTDSVCDLSKELLAGNQIISIPYRVSMQNGVFLDGLEADGDVIVRYLTDTSITASSEPPTVADYERFFSEQLTHAQHIIHVTTGRQTSQGYANACEASLAFSNVRVVDSGHLSSGMGMVAIEAARIVDSGVTDTDEIISQLERKKSKIQTSFIVSSTDYLYRGGRLSERMHRICSALMVHPILAMKDSNLRVGGIILGNRERTTRTYIRRALRDSGDIDKSVLFITYVGMTRAEIEAVRDMVQSIISFDKIYLQKASSAVSINSGPGTFGLLFSKK